MSRGKEKIEDIQRRITIIENSLRQIKENMVPPETSKYTGPYIAITHHPKEPDCRTVVQFQLKNHDWSKLEGSEDWARIVEFLEKVQTPQDRRFPKGLLG